MPLFTPISFSLPKAPSRQVIHSLDKYSFKEVLELKKTEDNFINVIHPQKKKPRDVNQVREMWLNFLKERKYTETKKPSFFYYKISNSNFQTVGFLGGADTSDIESNKITKHEKTFKNRVDHMATYVKAVQIQAEPVMMIHELPTPNELKPYILEKNDCVLDFDFDGTRHQLWPLDSNQSTILENWANSQTHFHLADGHHRIQCMVDLSKVVGKPLSVFSFLVHESQIKLNSFVWFTNEVLSQRFYLALEQMIVKRGGGTLKNNENLKSNYPLLIQVKQQWFGFSKETINSENIPNFIISKLLDPLPAPLPKLNYAPDLNESSLGSQSNNQLVFHMKPLSKSYLFDFAKKQKTLPAKSTFILPKMLTGLLISSVFDI